MTMWILNSVCKEVKKTQLLILIKIIASSTTISELITWL